MFFDPKQFLKNPVKRHRQSPRSSNQMNDIATYLEKLDLSSYVTIFVSNGFDTWEDVLDITESDLDYMGVKIGHRRRLQREIANYKGVSFESIIARTDRAPSVELGQPGDGENRQGRFEGQSSTGKRRYRRHPKPDKNAPERPPSAYVLFSNQVREELKPQNLSFTEIAKVVGERWQQLDTTGREPFETQAAVMKDEFNSKMAEYKRTDSWKEYQEYLQAFKASQTQSISSSGEGGKRLKLERSGEGSHASSRGSVGTPTSTHGSPVSHSSGNMHLSMPEAVSSTISSPVSTSGFPAAYTHQMLVARTGGTPPGRGPAIYPPSDVVSTAGSQHSGSSSLQNEPSRMLPRRSNNPAAPFLQPQRDSNDTSTGSMSSLQSSTSQASGSYTPVTPIDNTTVASRPADGSQSHVSPPASKMPPTGYSLPLPYSSVTTVNHDQASRILPPPQQPGGFQSTFSRGSLPPPIQPPLPSSTRQSPPHGNRMDGMSILALAGSMVDGGDPEDKKPQSS